MNPVEEIKSFLKQESSVKKAGTDAIDFAVAKGIVMRTQAKLESSEVVQHAPFTLFPSPVPKALIEEARDVQKDFNYLMHILSLNYEFLKSSYSSVLETDDFTRNLFNIYETVRKEKTREKTNLAIIRSDYMFHQPEKNVPSLKQVEVNMIAASFSGIGTEKVTALHEFTVTRAGHKEIAETLPRNNALMNIAQGMIAAWKHYGKPSAAVAFIVGPAESNIFDQRALEFKIYDINQDISVLRYTLSEVAEHGKLDENGRLVIGGREVAVVYFRTGYMPDNYPSQKEWDARLLLERSTAINCPCVGHQLVGAKKMQEVLAQPGVVEKFITDAESAKRVRNTFVGFYGLEMGADGDAAVAKVLKNPDNYVLKPQLEGGGNNLYGEDLVNKLTEIGNDKRRCSYIIMEKIRPMPVTTVILRAGSGADQFKPVEGVSELGIYGVLLATGEDIIHNSCAGHLLRTKASHFNDGGVAAGVAVLDSPLLV